METLLSLLLVAAFIAACSSTLVTDSEWNRYKMSFNKVYPSWIGESNARFNYGVNKGRINTHNDRHNIGTESYRLAVNQYSDLKFVDFAARFPPTMNIQSNGIPYALPPKAPQPSFSYAEQGFASAVQDQGIVCNSGWAYAAATALEIYYGVISSTPSPSPLSAQNFIDCAGASKTCINQVSQIAYDYLAIYEQRIYPTKDYPNRPHLGQGMCILPASQMTGKNLTAYSSIANGNDTALRLVINSVSPVVIRFNPGSFEFMHYKDGVFTQPAPTHQASHFLTVVGFGKDRLTTKDYWLVQNSFGTTWGETGFIRIEVDSFLPISESAIFPALL